MHEKLSTAILIALTLFVGACSDPNPEAPRAGQVHPQGWALLHADDPGTTADGDRCRACHGLNFEGSGRIPSCFECHLDGPPFSAHTSTWATTVAGHQTFADAFSWTQCANTVCHGSDLRSGQSGPSCFDATVSCHLNNGGPPPKPHADYDDPNLHGPEAKGADPARSLVFCRNCHGRPTNIFDGGMVADPAILAIPDGNCSSSALGCHPNAGAHPTNWQGTNDLPDAFNTASTHRTTSQLIRNSACGLCHSTISAGIGPVPQAPSCFSSQFTNANGSSTSCHPSGPGEPDHVVPFTDPNLHGPLAKANLVRCQRCHGESGGPGSNPRFNVAVGRLANGCEDCHAANAAHPPASVVLPSDNRWTFQYDVSSPRRTHFAAGNVVNACTLCHGGNLTGGAGPACTPCHPLAASNPPDLKVLDCTACHGTPPDGAVNLTGSATPVDHTAVTDLALFSSGHNECTVCHGSKEKDGAGHLIAANADYQIFPQSSQGGDHLDGYIEMNVNGAGYNVSTASCDIACHGNTAPYVFTNSGLTIEPGNYGNDPGPGCDFCHGYPPDGTADLTGAANFIDHTAVSDLPAFLIAHNDCVVCHGVKDDGTGAHSPVANYNVATDHRDDNIQMNSATQYNADTGGCDAACHSGAAPFQLTVPSGLNVLTADYGSGGGAGACDACHTTGVSGAPIVITNTSSHASGITCEGCHTGHGAGTVIIPSNAAVGINYPVGAEHQGGISLGGAATSGTTEAEICWNCHDASGGISEWGQNNKPNTGNAIYDYGSLSASNWVGATWTSANSNFAYKTAAIQSTHSVNISAAGPGVDINDPNDSTTLIRCSYCHDVHDTMAGSPDGAPYLRGTWLGNPYAEDGAPQEGTTYLNLARFGAVPRGNTAQSIMGGYWIDQNSGWPTTTNNTPNGSIDTAWELSNSAGLCVLCHGSNVDTMNIDQFGAADTDWVGSNGHSNSVIGGTGLKAANIFDLRDGVLAQTTTNPAMAFQGAKDPGDNGSFGFRNTAGDAARYTPLVNPPGQSRTYSDYEWGATVNASTIDSQYHKFPCSKCHNPHASRLPRLMITNCLDTKHNTWDDSSQLASAPHAGIINGIINNIDRSISNWTSAQNCHRLGGIASGSDEPIDPGAVPGTGSGWNNVTPW